MDEIAEVHSSLPNHTRALIEALEAPDSNSWSEGGPDPSRDDVLAAFREVHARSLHGFALLFTLGDRSRATRLTESALADAAGRVDNLRHPERAATWLRGRVVRQARTRVRLRLRPPVGRLAELGADEAVMRALAVLSQRERAALLASDVERFDRRDVASIVAVDGRALEGLLRHARERYFRAYADSAAGEVPDGPTVLRIRAIAHRHLA
jgi:DNA-directed RNA polymerase specialized sigma24 family protein